MMPNDSDQHHVVCSLRLDFQMPDREMARAIQERLSQLARGRILAEAETVFSEVCSPHVTQRLDKLVVNLGVLRSDQLEEAILERFAPRLKHALSDRLQAAPEQGGESPDGLAFRPAASVAELLDHMLKHGALPWWAGAHTGESLEEIFMQAATGEPGTVELMIRRLGLFEQPRLRLLRQFSETALAATVKLLAPLDAVWIMGWSEQVCRKSAFVAAGKREIYEAQWDFVLQVLSASRSRRRRPKAFLRRNLQWLAQRFATDLQAVIAMFAATAAETLPSGLHSSIQDLFKPLDMDKAAAKPSPAQRPRSALRAASHLAPAPGDSFFIENAGLVILSPFFVRYHQVNGLLEDGQFRDSAAAERGVHLLQMLITDGGPVLEQALVLNKVPCGLAPQTAVARELDATEEERANAQMVIQSAIQHWPAAGNLSVEGFRGSFLWRRGKLVRGEQRWTLTIEQRGYDVLFSSLPWSFSVIKHAWMPEPLYVEWV